MTQVETVALWIGLLGGVASIVLSIVAMTFAGVVNKRSSDVSDQTIRSLQKIESSVERLAADTRELIKAGWDKMLGSVDRGQDASAPDSSIKDIAAGLAAELRTELGLTDKTLSKPVVALEEQPRIRQLLRGFEDSLQAQLRLARPASRPSQAVDVVREAMGKVSLEAQALAHQLLGQHLTLEQYHRLRRSTIGEAVTELRRAGLLVPVRHRDAENEDEPAYYFRPGFGSALHVAKPLLPEVPPDVEGRVREELKKVGYRHEH